MGSGGISFVNRAGNSTRPHFPNSTPTENTHGALFTCYTAVKSALGIEDIEQDQHDQNRQRDLDPAPRASARDPSGHTVDDHLVRLRAERVAEKPDRHENVLEFLLGKCRPHFEVAMRVARYLLRAQAAERRFHLLP